MTARARMLCGFMMGLWTVYLVESFATTGGVVSIAFAIFFSGYGIWMAAFYRATQGRSEDTASFIARLAREHGITASVGEEEYQTTIHRHYVVDLDTYRRIKEVEFLATHSAGVE